MQLTTRIFPFFEIPNSAVRFVVIALAVGFPIAMLLSWLYELTPEGILDVKAKRLAKQNNEQDDYQNKAQTSARIISPASAIWPCRQGGDQEQNQNYEQYGTHNFLI